MLTIVPAFNESPTVGPIVRELLLAGMNVLVVDDGSSDDTSNVAESAGAMVVRTPRNIGKGGALLYALQFAEAEEDIAFFDADLLGFRAKHAERMLAAFAQGYDMVAGLRDHGAISNTMQLVAPLITGERILCRWVIDAIPEDCWNGYSIETAMNDAVARGGGKTALQYMSGVNIRTKLEKSGVVEGIKGHWRMFRQIVAAKEALAVTEGCSCSSCQANQ